MHNVDGFVLPAPRARLDDYRAIAHKAGEVGLEHGALPYFECVADDVQPVSSPRSRSPCNSRATR